MTDDWKPNGSSLFDVSNTQLLNHQATWSPIVSPPLSSSCDADDEPYFLNSYAVNTTMQQPSLSPCSSSAESDEMLHFTYGFGYTNQNALSESYGMLDHQSLLGNAASPIESDLYSWDTPNAQMNMVEEMSPIGCDPISYPLQSYPLDTFQQSDDIFLPTDFQKLSSAQPDVFDMSLQSEIIPYWSTPIYQANPTNIMETPYTWSYSA